MLHRKHFDNAAFMLAMLQQRQRALGLSDAELGRRTGHCHSIYGKWRSDGRRPCFASVVAVAEALGLKLEIKVKA